MAKVHTMTQHKAIMARLDNIDGRLKGIDRKLTEQNGRIKRR